MIKATVQSQLFPMVNKSKSIGHLAPWFVGVYQLASLGQGRGGKTHQRQEFSDNLLMNVEAGETLGDDARSSGSKWPLIPAGLIISMKSPHMVAPQ